MKDRAGVAQLAERQVPNLKVRGFEARLPLSDWESLTSL